MSDSESKADRANRLRTFGDVIGALDRLPLPVFAIRSDGVIRWLNTAAEVAVGNQVGQQFRRVVAPESQASVRDAFASKIVGARAATDYQAVFMRGDGSRVNVEISSVRLDGDGGIVGVFGVATRRERAQPRPMRVERPLTPRQSQVLHYLAQGYTTDQISAAMGIAVTTVRNHVRGLLRALDAHSRLEAVTSARLRGLV
jgi:PAS domain S-box-containing protein